MQKYQIWLFVYSAWEKKKKDYIVNWRAQQSDPHSGIFNAYECN